MLKRKNYLTVTLSLDSISETKIYTEGLLHFNWTVKIQLFLLWFIYPTTILQKRQSTTQTSYSLYFKLKNNLL